MRMKRLDSPLALAVQGFLLGAALFFTLDPLDRDQPPRQQPAEESILADIQA